MYGLSAKKNGRLREVAVVERWPVNERSFSFMARFRHSDRGESTR